MEKGVGLISWVAGIRAEDHGKRGGILLMDFTKWRGELKLGLWEGNVTHLVAVDVV